MSFLEKNFMKKRKPPTMRGWKVGMRVNITDEDGRNSDGTIYSINLDLTRCLTVNRDDHVHGTGDFIPEFGNGWRVWPFSPDDSLNYHIRKI